MTAPGNYPAIHTGGLAVIPIEHQTLLSAGLREKERGSGGGVGPYPSWPNRGIIQITNPVTVANYQHYLSLSWKPGMQFDFKDIRFAQQDGTICPYWIETYTSGVSATVWIKIPSASQRQILLYYGNPQAISESNGTNVFEFFDDFSAATLDSDKWTEDAVGSITDTTTGGKRRITNTLASGGTYWIYDGTDTGGGQHHAKWSPISTFIIEWENKISDTSGSRMGQGFVGLVDPSSTCIVAGGHYDGDGVGISPTRGTVSEGVPTVYNGYGISMTYATSKACSSSDNVPIKMIISSSSAWTVYINGELAASGTYSSTISKLAIMAGGYGPYPYLDYIEYDNIRVRKYSSTEPTLSLKQYGPRPDSTIIYYPFLPSPLAILSLKYDELIELTQTMTGETPLLSLGPIVTFTQTMIGSTPITDYYEAAISPTQTARVKVFAKLFLNLSLVRTKKITISKSIQDLLWRADIDLHQFKNLDMAVLRHCTYTTTDHLGTSHTLFTGILPGAQPQLAPADETTRITGYDYGWYLTQRKVPEAYLHNTAATDPATVITGLLGGDDWMTETGIEPYSIQTVSEWGVTLNTKVFDFDRTTSRLQAIQRICDYCRYVFIVKWRDIGGGILNPCAYFCNEDDIDTYLDLPDPVTFTKPDPYVDDKITWDVKGDEKYNRVTVYGRESDGTSISYTDETADVTNGDEIPVEFVERSGAFTTAAQVQARAEELLTYFSTAQKTYTITLNQRTDLEILQKVKFSGWTEIPDSWMRIISISYTIDDATATKRVQVQVTSETKLSQIRRMYRGMNPDPLSEADALFDAKAAAMPGNDVGTITAIDGNEATILLEDGRTVTARIV